MSVGQTAGWALDGDICGTPAGYCLAPGCCEYSRHCCDNAWAGYCQHRAKVDAFWSRVGGPKAAMPSGLLSASGLWGRARSVLAG